MPDPRRPINYRQRSPQEMPPPQSMPPGGETDPAAPIEQPMSRPQSPPVNTDPGVPGGQQMPEVMPTDTLDPEEAYQEDIPVQDPNVVEEMPEEEMSQEGMVEPYGSQILRRIHEDLNILLSEYDGLSPHLEQAEVKGLLVKLLQSIVGTLDEVEAMHGNTYPDLPSLIEEVAEELAEEASFEEGNIPPEEDPNDLSYQVPDGEDIDPMDQPFDQYADQPIDEGYGQVPDDMTGEMVDFDVPGVNDAVVDQTGEAVEADSAPEELPTTEEAIIGMQRGPRKQLTSSTEMAARGQKGTTKPNPSAYYEHRTSDTPGVADTYAAFETSDNPNELRRVGSTPDQYVPPDGVRHLPTGGHITYRDVRNNKGVKSHDSYPTNSYDPTGDMNQVEAPVQSDLEVSRFAPGLIELLDHEEAHVSDVRNFLNELSQSMSLEDLSRMKAYHMHKVLESIVNRKPTSTASTMGNTKSCGAKYDSDSLSRASEFFRWLVQSGKAWGDAHRSQCAQHLQALSPSEVQDAMQQGVMRDNTQKTMPDGQAMQGMQPQAQPPVQSGMMGQKQGVKMAVREDMIKPEDLRGPNIAESNVRDRMRQERNSHIDNPNHPRNSPAGSEQRNADFQKYRTDTEDTVKEAVRRARERRGQKSLTSLNNLNEILIERQKIISELNNKIEILNQN